MFIFRIFFFRKISRTEFAYYSGRHFAIHYSRHLNYLSLLRQKLACLPCYTSLHGIGMTFSAVMFIPNFVKIGQVIKADKKRGHLYTCCLSLEMILGWNVMFNGLYRVYLLSFFFARVLSQDVTAVASFLCGRAAELG